MRRTLVIIVTVAILGSLSVYAKDHNSTTSAQPTSTVTHSTGHISANNSSGSSSSQSGYKNGNFKGNTSQTPYGPVQVAAIISGGKITDVQFLQLPSDLSHSAELSSYAAPILKQSTLNSQNANIDFVSGATSTSYGYQQSIQSALDQAAVNGSAPVSNNGNSSTGSTGSSTPQSIPPFGGEGEYYDD